jgi:hypothetical protein
MNRTIQTFCLAVMIGLTGSCSAPEPAKPTGTTKEKKIMSPEAVMQAFCDLDAQGKRLPFYSSGEALSFYRELVHWTGEPNWDKVVIISGFTIGKTRQMPGYATIPVTYAVRGKYTTEVTAFYKSVERIEFRIIDTAEGWKIQSPVVLPHTYAATLIQGLQSRMKTAADAKEKKRLQKDIGLIKNMRRFLTDTKPMDS